MHVWLFCDSILEFQNSPVGGTWKRHLLSVASSFTLKILFFKKYYNIHNKYKVKAMVSYMYMYSYLAGKTVNTWRFRTSLLTSNLLMINKNIYMKQNTIYTFKRYMHILTTTRCPLLSRTTAVSPPPVWISITPDLPLAILWTSLFEKKK